MFGLDAEMAHEVGLASLRLGLASETAQSAAARQFATESFGPLERFGLTFANPVGVAAGFDKNGLVVNQLAALGFGFVEVGTVTYQPQTGNEKPRLFRLPDDGALLNRLGFNNDGATVVSERLRKLSRRCIVGVNIGRNKDVPNEEAVENYLASFELVHDVADYIVVNISSPNTPNLRELQRGENLEALLQAILDRGRALSLRQPISTTPRAEARTPAIHEGSSKRPPEGGTQNLKPLLVKIAPDLSENEMEEIVDICARLGIDGIIATNTTVSREGLDSPNVAALGPGGLSGRPLAQRSNEVIKTIYRRSNGSIPIIGVGGIFTADDAFEKIAAGASLLQSYTGFVYSGPSFASEINRGLRKILDDKGFSNLNDAIGSQGS